MAVKGMSLKRFYFVVILLSCNCFLLSCQGLCKGLMKIFGMDKGDTTQTKINNINVRLSTDELEDINDEEEKKYTCVFVSVVNCTVGKTNIINVVTGHNFKKDYVSTVGIESHTASVKVNNTTTIKLTLCDTSSQEGFQSLLKPFYRYSNAVLFVYDISNKDSLYYLLKETQIKDAKENTNKNTLFFLLGNKLDLAETDEAKRQVEEKVAQNFANDNGLIFLGECSAKNDKYCPSQNLPYKEELIKENDPYTNLKGILKTVVHNIRIKERLKVSLS